MVWRHVIHSGFPDAANAAKRAKNIQLQFSAARIWFRTSFISAKQARTLQSSPRIADTRYFKISRWQEEIKETRLVKPIRRSWPIRYVHCVRRGDLGILCWPTFCLQKKGNAMSGSEMAREKEKVAAKMREKQAAGKVLPWQNHFHLIHTKSSQADAKKAAEAGGKK